MALGRVILKRTAQGVGALCVLGSGYVAWDISRKTRSEGQSFREALRHYFLVAGLRRFGQSVWGRIDADSQNVQQAQLETLLQQIKDNLSTQYSQDFRLAEVQTREDFIRLHPLTRYDHYKPYVARISEGQQGVLTTDTPQILALTSGTSGHSSMVPMVKKQTAVFFKYGVAPCFYLMTDSFPDTYSLQKELKFFYTPRARDSIAGLPVGPNSSNPQNSQKVWSMYSTPPVCYNVSSEPEATYLYFLFALKDRNLGMLEANFASLIYSGIVYLEQHWRRLVQDIESGQLGEHLTVDQKVREGVNKLLKPDPVRARELREQFEKGFHGIVPRVWPQCHLLLTVDTGSFSLYGHQLSQSYTEGIPIYSPLYGATEGLLGLNINPRQSNREYLLLPRAMFFEFIPIEHSEEDQPKTLFMDQVEAGQTYELAITNMSCLYRYRLGDVVKVTGFHKQCPKVEFLYRQGQFLNIRGEKTSERSFYDALVAASAGWKDAKLRDYCCTPSVVLEQAGGPKEGSAPHYVLFVEVDGHDNLSRKEISMIDDQLRLRSFSYDSLRQKGSLGPVQVCQMRPGTFQKLKLFQVNKGTAASNQYKVPRVIHRHDVIVYLLSHLSY